MLINNPDKTDIFILEQPTKTRIPVVLDQMTNECVTIPFDEEPDKLKNITIFYLNRIETNFPEILYYLQKYKN